MCCTESRSSMWYGGWFTFPISSNVHAGSICDMIFSCTTIWTWMKKCSKYSVLSVPEKMYEPSSRNKFIVLSTWWFRMMQIFVWIQIFSAVRSVIKTVIEAFVVRQSQVSAVTEVLETPPSLLDLYISCIVQKRQTGREHLRLSSQRLPVHSCRGPEWRPPPSCYLGS